MARSIDDRAAALQLEIRCAGDTTDHVRSSLWCAVALPLGSVIIWGAIVGLVSGAGLAALLLGMLAGCAAAFALGAAAAVPVCWAYRALRSLQMRRALHSLPRQHVQAILLPLRHDRTGDTRKLASALLRGVRLPKELAPAAASSGRGDEAVAG